jgi:hypothetical protein
MINQQGFGFAYVFILKAIHDVGSHGFPDSHGFRVALFSHDAKHNIPIGQYTDQPLFIAYWENPDIQRFHDPGGFFDGGVGRNHFSLRSHHVLHVLHRRLLSLASCVCRSHIAAEAGATPAFGSTVAAEGMLGRMAFAGLGTAVAYIGAESAQQLR